MFKSDVGIEPMKCILSLFVLSLGILTGCASSPYGQARAFDAMDIFSFTTGYGGGAKAMIGPLHAGLFLNFDEFGLRGGLTSKEWKKRGLADQFEWDGFPFPLGPMAPVPSRYPLVFGMGTVSSRTTDHYWLLDYTIPFVAWPKPHLLPVRKGSSSPKMSEDYKPTDHANSYYTQIEIAGGLVGTMRLGVNPGEFLDFLVGWLGMDLYGDDKEVPALAKEKTENN